MKSQTSSVGVTGHRMSFGGYSQSKVCERSLTNPFVFIPSLAIYIIIQY